MKVISNKEFHSSVDMGKVSWDRTLWKSKPVSLKLLIGNFFYVCDMVSHRSPTLVDSTAGATLKYGGRKCGMHTGFIILVLFAF